MKNIVTFLMLCIALVGYTQNLKVESINYKTKYTLAERNALTLGVDDRKLIYVVDTGVNEMQIWDGDSWETLGADNLGSHTATQSLNLNGNSITNIPSIFFNTVEESSIESNASNLTLNHGTLVRLNAPISRADNVFEVGQSDFVNGTLKVMGSDLSDNGKIVLENPANNDTDINDYSLETLNGNLILKANGGANGSVVPVFTVNSSTLQTGFGNYEFPRNDGTSGQVLTTDGSGNVTFQDASGGSVSGNNTEIQFNNAGSFGSSSNLKWDNTDTSILLGNTGKLKTYNASNYVALEALTGKNIRITTFGSGDHLGINSGNTDVSSIYLGASFTSKNAVFMLRGGNAANNTDATEYVRFEQKNDGLNIDLFKGFYWVNGGAFLYNTDQGNHDFRIYGQSDTSLFRADVSADRIGVGVSLPTQKLEVNGNVKADTFIANGYTFATLPTPTTGMICYITDASSVSYRGTAAGGGSDFALVMYNGTNWIYH